MPLLGKSINLFVYFNLKRSTQQFLNYFQPIRQCVDYFFNDK